VADRYFCLSPRAQEIFLRALEGEDETLLATLASAVPLSCDPSHPPIVPCPNVVGPARNLLDESLPRPEWRITLLSAISLPVAQLRLRICGLAGTIHYLRLRKLRLARSAGDKPGLSQTVAAYRHLRYIATESDKCLARSVAVAGRLMAIGVAADLVIGVKLQPFAAHAWVQCGEWLANDRVDVVRDFTPILVV